MTSINDADNSNQESNSSSFRSALVDQLTTDVEQISLDVATGAKDKPSFYVVFVETKPSSFYLIIDKKCLTPGQVADLVMLWSEGYLAKEIKTLQHLATTYGKQYDGLVSEIHVHVFLVLSIHPPDGSIIQF